MCWKAYVDLCSSAFELSIVTESNIETYRRYESENETQIACPVVRGQVLPGYFSPKNIGMLDINTTDGRFLFVIPWPTCQSLACT